MEAMVYAAVGLIFLGLVCLGYVALTMLRRPEEAGAPSPYAGGPGLPGGAPPGGAWNRAAPAFDPSQGRPYWNPAGTPPPQFAPRPTPRPAQPQASQPPQQPAPAYPQAGPGRAPVYGEAPSYEEWMRRHATPRPPASYAEAYAQPSEDWNDPGAGGYPLTGGYPATGEYPATAGDAGARAHFAAEAYPGGRSGAPDEPSASAFSGQVGSARMPRAAEDPGFARGPAGAAETPDGDSASDPTATRDERGPWTWTRIPSYESVSRLDTRRLAESLKAIAARESAAERRERTEQLVVAGALYLDHGRRVDQLKGADTEEIPPRLFAELKRAGQGSLVAEGGSFRIHCGPASYHYSAGELDQILFHAAGVALIPALPDRPAPVFLTEESERLKEYVKKRARQASS